MPRHPTFKRGHCFMTTTLNRPEVELVGALIHAHLRTEEGQELRAHFDKILAKIDYPAFDDGAKK